MTLQCCLRWANCNVACVGLTALQCCRSWAEVDVDLGDRKLADIMDKLQVVVDCIEEDSRNISGA